jgi:Type II restriction endonuclease EcoO109I
MARGHAGLPQSVTNTLLSKHQIFDALKIIDSNKAAKQRVLTMELEFRKRIDNHLAALPASNAQFQKFNTSPFVLMFYSRQKSYNYVSQIEKDIIPAKVFSSMETSAGRMVETVVLPIYGWETVPSKMHSVESVLDGRKQQPNGLFMAATLKSGPRCLNDEMAKDIGVDVVTNAQAWATSHNARSIDFTYGVLYGTKKQSNKKDWHILRNIGEAIPRGATLQSPCTGRWDISYSHGNLNVRATVRVGIEWWDHLGGPNTWIELCVALIRACIAPARIQSGQPAYVISDLADILDLGTVPANYNVALLQRSQFEWLFFLARHFCDELIA